MNSAAERQPYEELFRLLADTIYETTNGAHKIRNVTFYDRARFADRADIQWIQFEQQPRATLNSYGKGRGTVHMGDAIFSASTLITDPNGLGVFVNTLGHEWGHYAYGVFDEYVQQAGDTPPEPCSIMCAAPQDINFGRLNFSTPKSDCRGQPHRHVALSRLQRQRVGDGRPPCQRRSPGGTGKTPLLERPGAKGAGRRAGSFRRATGPTHRGLQRLEPGLGGCQRHDPQASRLPGRYLGRHGAKQQAG